MLPTAVRFDVVVPRHATGFPISLGGLVILVGRVGLFARRGALALLLVGAVWAQAVLAAEKVSYASDGDIVLQAASAKTHVGKWTVAADKTAAGGTVMRQKNTGAKKIYVAATKPANYFEMTFQATAGKPYRLWVHGRADRNYWANDSVFVQFSGSVTESGAAKYRIGTTSAAEVNLEDCRHCGISGWTWQDNGYGADALGPAIYFAKSGSQTIRVQTREDGLSIDQILLSPRTYLKQQPVETFDDDAKPAKGPAPAPKPQPKPEPKPQTEPAPSPTAGDKLRVLQWNLHHGTDSHGKYDIVRIAQWMAKMKPDVIMLNEVEKYTGWGNENQPARYEAMMEQLTGRKWYGLFSQEFGNWSANGKGHLILSRYPFESTAREEISYDRVIGSAGITVNGRTISLIVTHLDPESHSRRLAQAKEVTAWASSIAESRILTGDMNAWPDQTSIAEFNKHYRDSWTDAKSKGKATEFPGLDPDGATKNGRIDYIFYSRSASHLTVLDSRVYDTREPNKPMASDHRPVVTTFQVR
jgi:endonuclease/exonuclease/phosphatase family metal-dependent hydrolase